MLSLGRQCQNEVSWIKLQDILLVSLNCLWGMPPCTHFGIGCRSPEGIRFPLLKILLAGVLHKYLLRTLRPQACSPPSWRPCDSPCETVFTPMYIPLSMKTSKGFHFLIKGSQFWCLRTTLGLIHPSFHATASTPCQHLPTDYCGFLCSAFLPFSPCPVFHLPQSCQQSENINLMSYSTLYLLGKHTDWNCLLWLGTTVTTCTTNFTTGGHSKEHRTNKPPTTRRIWERSKRDTVCPTTSQNPSCWRPSWLSNAWATRKDSESEGLAKDSLKTNPITIKSETASYVAEQFSWVPLPYCSLPGCPFPIKSLALSAHVSPHTIHFQVLDKSPDPGKGVPLPVTYLFKHT